MEFYGTPEEQTRWEVSTEVEDRYALRLGDAEVAGWRTVADVHRSILAGSTTPPDPGTVWAWLRDLLAGWYGVAPGQVFPEAELFGDPLWLQDRGAPRSGPPGRGLT